MINAQRLLMDEEFTIVSYDDFFVTHLKSQIKQLLLTTYQH
jgi:hypothetical protein